MDRTTYDPQAFAKTGMEDLAGDLRRDGFAVRSASAMRAMFAAAWFGWDDFAASWNDLPEDTHMADGGRYRRRRFAVFDVRGSDIARAPHQPHYQSRAYNQLNGGIARWFEPVSGAIAAHPLIRGIVAGAIPVFETVVSEDAALISWHVEMHQFRIEAHPGRAGLPTPEGVHRDGVDGAFVMLVKRCNISSGVTQIFDPKGNRLGAFTLAEPGDAVYLDDARVFHGVTPIAPQNPKDPAYRDVLVITFLRNRPE
jgi:hypothetical protein